MTVDRFLNYELRRIFPKKEVSDEKLQLPGKRKSMLNTLKYFKTETYN